MARESLPPKGPIPERVREALDGPPKNAELQAALLERARAELVVMYRRSSSPWPDGIDTASDRWYGDGSTWTDARIEAALDKSIFEGKPFVKRGRPSVVDKPNTLTAKKPWEAEGISRRTWYNRRDKREGV